MFAPSFVHVYVSPDSPELLASGAHVRVMLDDWSDAGKLVPLLTEGCRGATARNKQEPYREKRHTHTNKQTYTQRYTCRSHSLQDLLLESQSRHYIEVSD